MNNSDASGAIMDSDGNGKLDNYDHNLAMSKATKSTKVKTYYQAKAKAQGSWAYGNVQTAIGYEYDIIEMGYGARLPESGWTPSTRASVPEYSIQQRIGLMGAGGSAYIVGAAVSGVGTNMMRKGVCTLLAAQGLVPETWGLSETATPVACAYALSGALVFTTGKVGSGWGADVFMTGLTGVDRPTMPERLRDDWENGDAWGMAAELAL